MSTSTSASCSSGVADPLSPASGASRSLRTVTELVCLTMRGKLPLAQDIPKGHQYALHPELIWIRAIAHFTCSRWSGSESFEAC